MTMKNNITLTIPNPCSEKWENFTSTATGGFCSSCSKNVVDFTKLGDDEILDFFRQKPAHTCGRFRADQVKVYTATPQLTINPGMALFKAGFVGLLLLFMNRQSFAQGAPAQTKTQVTQAPVVKGEVVTRPATNPDQTVRGVVKDDFGQGLPGVSILLFGTQLGTVTDADGRFEFPRKLKEGDKLIFSFIGFETKEYIVPKEVTGNTEVAITSIEMETHAIIMGAVAVEEPYAEPSGIKKAWNKVKAVF